MKPPILLALLAAIPAFQLSAQTRWLGCDLSYVNEMEDCGVAYKVDGQVADPYLLFAERGCNLVRLRLWHTPSWYDTLNTGQRYSDFADVHHSIQRARDAGMAVLLDFHLSDTWADPGKQRVPAAWEPIVDDLPTLQDSLYQYIHSTLMRLYADGLLPEMVQIGNETNKGILLSPEDDASGWVLDWPRNAALFNTAIQAVRDVEDATGQSIKVAIHPAGPENALWLVPAFVQHGVTDFDLIGISYYWQWHQPTDIDGAADVISQLRQQFPDKEVMIFETGYPWTLLDADAANNILSVLHPEYSPASPQHQRQWLIDLTEAVLAAGGSGVIYWEPAWVSSPCHTSWGQGSHYENAAFFDFEHELIENGGIGFLSHPYATGLSANEARSVQMHCADSMIVISWQDPLPAKTAWIDYTDMKGSIAFRQTLPSGALTTSKGRLQLPMPHLPKGAYVLSLQCDKGILATARLLIP